MAVSNKIVQTYWYLNSKWIHILNSGYSKYRNSHSHTCLTGHIEVVEREKTILVELACHVHCNTFSSSPYCIDRNVHIHAEQIKTSQVNSWDRSKGTPWAAIWEVTPEAPGGSISPVPTVLSYDVWHWETICGLRRLQLLCVWIAWAPPLRVRLYCESLMC